MHTEVPLNPHVNSFPWYGVPRLFTQEAGLDFTALLDGKIPRNLPPELTPVHPSTDSEEAELWRLRISEGWRLLVRTNLTTSAEISKIVRVVAPLRSSPKLPTSATLGDAFGCVVMSLPHNALLTAVTLVHEAQHAKLAALLDVIPLVDIDSEKRFYAPWREDPRPAIGLLHGLYAHVGIAGFWRTHRHTCDGTTEQGLHAHVEFVRWTRACEEAARTLLTGDVLTPPGHHFVSAIAEQVAQWSAEHTPGKAVVKARQQADDHRTRWARR